MVFFQKSFIFLFIIYFFILSILKKDFFYFFEIIFLILNICFLGNLIFIVNDFFFFFVLFEGISLSIYILALVSLTSLKTAEAGLKYFLYGVFVSIFLLISFLGLFYLFGTLNISKIILFQEQDFFNNFILFQNKFNNYIYFNSIFLIFCCLFFKIGLVPFHLQVIDVYSNVLVSIFFLFMIITKFLFCILLFKAVFFQFKFTLIFYFDFFVFFGILSIFISSIGIINEIYIRRILAQSSINHMGFLLLFCTSNIILNLINFLIYLYIYIFILVLFFFGFFFIKQSKYNFETLFDLSALSNISKFLMFYFIFIFFMMSGLPPFTGFQIKQLVFQSFNLYSCNIIFFKFFVLFFILILNVINIYIYLRFIIYLCSESSSYFILKQKQQILLSFLSFFNYFSLVLILKLHLYLFNYIFSLFCLYSFVQF